MEKKRLFKNRKKSDTPEENQAKLFPSKSEKQNTATASQSQTPLPDSHQNWKILIVDDDEDIHAVTKIALRDFAFEDRPIQFLSAYTAQEARRIIEKNQDIAILLLDVVMESTHAGLELVRYIREDLHNHFMRIVLRTGQPGEAPEKEVILNYQIDDYKTKTELTKDKLFTVVTASMRTYEAIINIESYRRDLDRKVKQRTEQLENQTQELLKLKKAVETTEVGITITDTHGKIVYTNPADAAMHGYSTTELIDQPSNIFGPPELRKQQPNQTENFHQYINWKREGLNLRKDGTTFPVKLISNIIRDQNDQPIGMVVVCEDITQRLRNEEMLRKLSRAVEQSSSSILITDTEGVIEFVNPAFTQTTGFEPEEVIGQTPRILKSGKHTDSTYEQLWETILAGNVWQGELINRRKNGKLYWQNIRITPVKNTHGQTSHFIAIQEDITVRKNAEIALKKSEKQLRQLNATKDKFFTIIGHDLKNPITTLLGFTELVRDMHHTFEPEELQTILTEINTSANQLHKLLQNLLDWAQTQTGRIKYEPQKVDLHLACHQNIELLKYTASKKNISIQNEIPVQTFTNADLNMLDTIMRNLLTNAIKFTPSGGHITITHTPQNGFHQIAITDTGVGLTSGQIQRLFQIQHTHSTKGTNEEPGTGLGLILCHEFIGMHKGKIWAESSPNQGTTFFFTLPEYE